MKHILGFLCCAFLGVSFSADALVVLQYHHISDETPASTSTSPEVFEQHLQYLDRHDFDVIGLDKLAELIRHGKPLPDRTVVITFDDGYLSVYKQAYPRLTRYGFPFSVFINTQPHDAENPLFMSWEQMREMSDSGVTFANHTVSHPHLLRRAHGESAVEWEQRVWNEISRAEETIHQQLQQHHKLLAYPYGEYNAALKKLLDEKGYLAFGQQSGPVSPGSDGQALPRFPFGGVYGDLKGFIIKVNTLPMPVKSVRVYGNAGTALREPELPAEVSRPQLALTFDSRGIARQITCFASGQGSIPVEVQDNRAIAHAPEALPVGRSRYNCTASSGEAGRFYWYSQMFIRRQPDGDWYPE
jgi:biofilm PGA synthesis lipoprotein PgaB